MTIGFAILGPGIVADHNHKPAIEANADLGARLIATAHHNPAKFSQFSEQFGVPCQSYEDVLANPDVDVICICTPSGQHAKQTIAAAQAGKNVLVEKPMALSLADADAMIEACDKAGVKLGVTFQRRYEPYFSRIHQAIEAGDFGDLTLGVVTIPYHRPQDYFNLADWRGTWALDGGGVLMNQGIHLVDLMRLFAGEFEEIHSFVTNTYWHHDVEDNAYALMRSRNGAMGIQTSGWYPEVAPRNSGSITPTTVNGRKLRKTVLPINGHHRLEISNGDQFSSTGGVGAGEGPFSRHPASWPR